MNIHLGFTNEYSYIYKIVQIPARGQEIIARIKNRRSLEDFVFEFFASPYIIYSLKLWAVEKLGSLNDDIINNQSYDGDTLK